MSNKYKIGHVYTDKGGISHPNDQFLRWINIEGSGMGNSEGIRALNYVQKDSKYLPAYIILVSHEIKRSGNPWQDFVDFNSATITYWGDAKYDIKKKYDSFKGNKRLLQVREAVLDGLLKQIPPILYFSKPKTGVVEFKGLCVMEDLQITWFEDQGRPVKNYRIELAILDCEDVSIEWLHERARCVNSDKLNEHAPRIWKDYIKGNTRKLDVWKQDILSKEDQLPQEKSKDARSLEQLRNLTPTEFEAVVVDIFKKLPHVSHKITRTEPTGDGGVDFIGQFVIPFPIGYEIKFLGEAKKFSRDNAVQPKHVSRLVARLDRGQYGIFVTTSYYTRQTQREVLVDKYPVRLFSGLDCIKFLHEIGAIQKGKLNKLWLESVIQEV
jgi:restriction endonuclease Mrr